MLKILKYLFQSADEFLHSMGLMWEDVFFLFIRIFNIATHNLNYIVIGLLVLAVGYYIYIQKN